MSPGETITPFTLFANEGYWGCRPPHLSINCRQNRAFLLSLTCSIPHAEVSNHTSLCIASGGGDRPGLPVWRHRHARCRRDRTIHLRGIGVMVIIDACIHTVSYTHLRAHETPE